MQRSDLKCFEIRLRLFQIQLRLRLAPFEIRLQLRLRLRLQVRLRHPVTFGPPAFVPGAERASTGGARLALKAGCKIPQMFRVTEPVAAETAATNAVLIGRLELHERHLEQGAKGRGSKHDISNLKYYLLGRIWSHILGDQPSVGRKEMRCRQGLSGTRHIHTNSNAVVSQNSQ
jgi:hypothetical protein